ncbi:hypothetical protein GCM10010498_07370 [Streptomyces cavourensis]|nr:hypothetical protein GCM10010498_07370 [Streptomyces cavourensis]
MPKKRIGSGCGPGGVGAPPPEPVAAAAGGVPGASLFSLTGSIIPGRGGGAAERSGAEGETPGPRGEVVPSGGPVRAGAVHCGPGGAGGPVVPPGPVWACGPVR